MGSRRCRFRVLGREWCGGANWRYICEADQFALGGLVGYNFTGISLQAYLTRDVWTQNYFNPSFECTTIGVCSKAYETRFWTRVVVPLWSPPAIEQVTYKQ